MGDIVVGVDGSPGSILAVQWALEEAKVRSSRLRLLCVYQSPTAWLGMSEALGSAVGTTVSEEDLASYAQETIDESLQSLEIPSDVVIVKDSIEGHAGSALVDSSKDADLLVVGSKGHSDLHGALLGSVGMYCVHHAQCPVVLVPKKKKK